jgi:hypothetical protein
MIRGQLSEKTEKDVHPFSQKNGLGDFLKKIVWTQSYDFGLQLN